VGTIQLALPAVHKRPIKATENKASKIPPISSLHGDLAAVAESAGLFYRVRIKLLFMNKKHIDEKII
jgi:hypothetical protein